MLSRNWDERLPHYNFIIVGSGYGGSITAARLATADLPVKPSVCILERGKEWPVGTFPDTLDGLLQNRRSSINPLGLYEYLIYEDISVIKGSGLGGTSLINANVAIMPDPEVFQIAGWPASLNHLDLQPYYERARRMLAVTPHPNAHNLLKVQAMDRRAQEIGATAAALDIAVNFKPEGPNEQGVLQKPCIDCGDCVTGCNVSAKNTLYMNYLPMAANAGAQILTQTKVEWIEKVDGGGWRVHGRHYRNATASDRFTLTADNIIMAAGAINTTEILLRSEMHGLSVSPMLGSGFSGNGDFFGLAYNGDFQTGVLGFGNRPGSPGAATPPGPSIVSVVRYHGGELVERRVAIEDLSFPSGYIQAARAAFALVRGEDTDTGDEAQERQRVLRDLAPLPLYQPEGALNHTMLYLCMGFDDARGSIIFEAPWFEPDGRVRIHWDDVGRQVVFTRINEELRRHSRAQGGSFIQNPLWTIFDARHLITAHPIGGCPIGADYMQGAVDEWGRVFAADGSVHNGLLVADGSLIPSALGVNPFLTISAISERIAERKIRDLAGDPYPEPVHGVAVSSIDPLEAIDYTEPELERLFRRIPSMPAAVMINTGERTVDEAARLIRNDAFWKGFFPKRHILNTMSSAIFTGFRKEFFHAGSEIGGITSDTDGRIRARNTIEEIDLKERRGDLEPGKYILLRYVDPPWQGFYDVFKVINQNLLIGRVYAGSFPNGRRMFTFPMTRVYEYDRMSVEDHRSLYAAASAPSPEQLKGVWRMDAISNANHAGSIAHLAFDPKPDGRIEARYQLLGLMEGLVVPSAVSSHFQLDDFTPFHDEIRLLAPDLMIGKYVLDLPDGIGLLAPSESLGLLHTETEANRRRFGFYYLLSRVEAAELPRNPLLQPFLDVRVPDGITLTFDETMVGWYFPGVFTSAAGRAGDLEIAARISQDGDPPGAVSCSFTIRLTARDVNEFVDGSAHEARAKGTISFGAFAELEDVTFNLNERTSSFNYLRVNEVTREAEMRYHLTFETPDGRSFLFEGCKYMQKDSPAGPRGAQEVLDDYTTLYCHVYDLTEEEPREIGTAFLKFRTFEDLAAVGNFAGFLRSFQITGTSDPLIQLQARMRFLAFTGRFVQYEYDPLALPGGRSAAYV
jgi:cholesterol oxidase